MYIWIEWIKNFEFRIYKIYEYIWIYKHTYINETTDLEDQGQWRLARSLTYFFLYMYI